MVQNQLGLTGNPVSESDIFDWNHLEHRHEHRRGTGMSLYGETRCPGVLLVPFVLQLPTTKPDQLDLSSGRPSEAPIFVP